MPGLNLLTWHESGHNSALFGCPRWWWRWWRWHPWVPLLGWWSRRILAVGGHAILTIRGSASLCEQTLAHAIARAAAKTGCSLNWACCFIGAWITETFGAH